MNTSELENNVRLFALLFNDVDVTLETERIEEGLNAELCGQSSNSFSYLRSTKGIPMIELATRVAQEAGEFLKKSLGGIRHIERKKGEVRNLVTEIDKKSEELIISRIREKYPDHDFLGEESGSRQVKSDYKWIIDPLDGTTNFAHGLPIFCVSIGLEVRGKIEAGVVYNPNMDELFTAERGKGAFLNGRGIHVSPSTLLIDSLVVTGFPYDIQDNPYHAVELFSSFLMETRAVRRLGSAAIDLCYIAAGRFDGYWEVSLNPWDMAAGVLLVEEAGGRFTDFAGTPSTVYKNNVLATNGLIHDQMLAVVGRVSGEKSKGQGTV
jgi:myo-inositol-1(or 4)-monophosphatase